MLGPQLYKGRGEGVIRVMCRGQSVSGIVIKGEGPLVHSVRRMIPLCRGEEWSVEVG